MKSIKDVDVWEYQTLQKFLDRMLNRESLTNRGEVEFIPTSSGRRYHSSFGEQGIYEILQNHFDDYKETIKEMSLTEIEQELGHRIKIVNK